MDIKKLQKELENAEIEIEEIAMQLADMLGAALYFAGVKKEDLPKVVDLYLQGIDEVFEGEDEDAAFTAMEKFMKEIVPEWLKKAKAENRIIAAK